MKYSLVNFCEFDKYAAKSYCAIHGTSETLNLGDITKVDEMCIRDRDQRRGIPDYTGAVKMWHLPD